MEILIDNKIYDIPESINKIAFRRYNNPQRGAFYKGIVFDLSILNPYIYKGGVFQNNSKKFNWRISFSNAFEHGRKLKTKYNLIFNVLNKINNINQTNLF